MTVSDDGFIILVFCTGVVIFLGMVAKELIADAVRHIRDYRRWLHEHQAD